MSKPKKITAVTRMKRAHDRISDLESSSSSSSDLKKWKRDTEIAIQNTFGEKSRHFEEFRAIRYVPLMIVSGMPRSVYQEAYSRGLQSARAVLVSMIDEIKEYWEEDTSPATVPVRQDNQRNSRRVFIIHGRDDGIKAIVARFLEKLSLDPVILHEQPNQGRTIIEKFEDYGHPSFAVAILTPDDIGGLATTQPNCRPRARQNVVFEFGYFIGRIGRERVCAITKGEVEIPSDCDGVLYIPVDGVESWEVALLRELRAAGLKIDANQVL